MNKVILSVVIILIVLTGLYMYVSYSNKDPLKLPASNDNNVHLFVGGEGADISSINFYNVETLEKNWNDLIKDCPTSYRIYAIRQGDADPLWYVSCNPI